MRTRVGCSDDANGPCSITLILKARVNTRLLAAQSAPLKKKTITLGKKKLGVPAGAHRRARVALTKPGRKVLASVKTLRGVQIIVRATDEGGKLPTTKKTVRLKVPRRA